MTWLPLHGCIYTENVEYENFVFVVDTRKFVRQNNLRISLLNFFTKHGVETNGIRLNTLRIQGPISDDERMHRMEVAIATELRELRALLGRALPAGDVAR